MTRWVLEDFFKKWCVGVQLGVSFACLSREAFKKWLHVRASGPAGAVGAGGAK